MCHGKPYKRKKSTKMVGVGWWGNSSSKAFSISFADRPKAKRTSSNVFAWIQLLIIF
jgi:hypothetical protein